MQGRRQLILGAALAIAILAAGLAVPAVAGKHDSGELDRSFASDGVLVVRDVRARGRSVAIGRKGRIAIAGHEIVTRLLPDGRLDRSFAGDGIWRVGEQGSNSSTVSFGSSSVTIQRKGGVVVAGRFCLGGECDFAVRRLTKRGQLDRSFGDDGMARISFKKPLSTALSVARAREGKLVVGGDTCSQTSCDVALARLNRNGSLDRSFGDRGKVVTSCSHDFEMALDSHHRIVVGRSCPGATVNLMRFKPGGEVDRSFGNHGHVHARPAHIKGLSTLAVDSHDRIVVADHGGERKARVLRYNPSGKLDRSFGNDGIATIKFPGYEHPSPVSAAIDHRGRFVLGGDFERAGFTRLRPGGRLDRSFGHKGLMVTINNFSNLSSVAIDRRDRIVGVGWHGDHPAAARLLP